MVRCIHNSTSLSSLPLEVRECSHCSRFSNGKSDRILAKTCDTNIYRAFAPSPGCCRTSQSSAANPKHTMRRRSGKHTPQTVDEVTEDVDEKSKVPKVDGGHGVALALVIVFLAPILQSSIGNRAFRQTAWFLTMVGIAYLGVLFWRYEHWRREVKPFRRFVVCFVILLLELLLENFLCWVVSALDKNKYSYTPLQDLGEELLVWLCNVSRPVHFFLRNFKGWSIHHFMLTVVIVAAGVVFPDRKLAQRKLSGFAMAAQVAATVALSRAIRTVSFISTILPNPRYHCYYRKFPPVPDNWLDFVRVGFSRLRGNGGCNDLIFSGHGGIYTVALCLFQTYYGGKTSFLVWTAFVHVMCMEILDKTHYTVDMVLAWIVTSLAWYRLSWLGHTPEETGEKSKLEIYLPSICIGILTILLVIIMASDA